jgi:hypothetical protein
MLSQYEVECPECGYPRATHCRQLNSLATHLECPRCGLYKRGLLPRSDEKLERRLFRMAENRMGRIDLGIAGVGGFWLQVAYTVVAGFYTRDVRLVLVLVGILIATLRIPRIHNQLAYLNRLLQHRHVMDSDLHGILANEPTNSDLVYDYEVCAGAHDQEGVSKLDNRYYAFVHWLAAELRSVGHSREVVERETSKLRKAIDQEVRANRA